jgi:hypothetical protein
MSQRRRFSKVEFDRGAAISRMEPGTIALARAILVEGRPQAVVAREKHVGRSWVSRAVGKMREYIEEANPVPPGWRTDTVTLPESDWPKVRQLERAAQEALSRKDRERS